ncbi:kinase-like protein [Punctularia strigosozonata HHB-11173 SS5]|uniref:kinase-like protein n=1 Tax=Punctularia strigosozonata (strain HHB-11173) TaxID=741275 RepID=UPI0004416A82|nr:kinase-like protein [Punctularia strigosozonata HHB-11173 SS5]EIN06807.1 kinase-like protein [Punctularia strigosozonata HHB-11173 SS5]
MRGIRIWEVLCRGDERRAILPLWGCGIAGAYSYTVSPLGYGDVGMYIDQNPGVDRLLLLIQMAECVKSLHDRNIVHGDLFETRFVVMEERYGVRVYLTGFYETEMLDTHGRVTCPWTVSDWNRLSWRAAPEMTAPGPCRVYGKPVDIWALGFLIMQLMTGRVPAHSTQYFMAHPDCLPSRPYGMTLRLYALVRACWSFRPAERPCIDQTITWLKQCRRQLLLDA